MLHKECWKPAVTGRHYCRSLGGGGVRFLTCHLLDTSPVLRHLYHTDGTQCVLYCFAASAHSSPSPRRAGVMLRPLPRTACDHHGGSAPLTELKTFSRVGVKWSVILIEYNTLCEICILRQPGCTPPPLHLLPPWRLPWPGGYRWPCWSRRRTVDSNDSPLSTASGESGPSVHGPRCPEGSRFSHYGV